MQENTQIPKQASILPECPLGEVKPLSIMSCPFIDHQTHVSLFAPAYCLPGASSDTLNTVCHSAFVPDKNYKYQHVKQTQQVHYCLMEEFGQITLSMTRLFAGVREGDR